MGIPQQFKDTVASKYGYDFPEPANETELMAYRMLEEAGLLYAQDRWDQACDEQKANCFEAFANSQITKMSESINSAPKPEFKP